MGKNITIYASDELLNLLDSVPNKGKFLTELVEDHFSNDVEVLQAKLELIDKERNRLIARLNEKVESKLKAETLRKRRALENEEEREKAYLLEEFKKAWQDEKVSDDDYWKAFKENNEVDFEHIKQQLQS
jgi:16S rRNA G527 N7-methylase RsmG